MSRKSFISLPLAAAALALSSQALAAPVPVIVANWSMNNTLQATGADGVTVVPASVSLVGGTSGAYVAGMSNANGDKAYNTSAYPTSVKGNMIAGIGFAVSSVGFQNLSVSWDDKRSATAANSEMFEYSTDGVHFIAFGGVQKVSTSSAFVHHSFDLSGLAGVNNDANFAFRVVSAYDVNGAYVGTTSNYGSGGTIRFDNMTVRAVSAVSEPETAAMFAAGLGLLGLLSRRKAARAA